MSAYSAVFGSVLRGVEALPVKVECSIEPGIPSIRVLGGYLRDTDEMRARVRGALRAAGFALPRAAITINLAPTDSVKGPFPTMLDMAVGVSILAATGQIPSEGLEHCVFAGMAQLDGTFDPRTCGSAAVAKMASSSRMRTVLPVGAQLLDPRNASCLDSFATLRSGVASLPAATQVKLADSKTTSTWRGDYGALLGWEQLKQAMMVAAVGDLNVCMVGTSSFEYELAARALPGVLDGGTNGAESAQAGWEGMEEAFLIRSASGLSQNDLADGLRPFRQPHHSISLAGLVGGGRPVMPGEVSLASGGVLYLDALEDWSPRTLEMLHAPAECGNVRLVRSDGVYVFPARFQLLASAAPLPNRGDNSMSRIVAYQQALVRSMGGMFDMTVATVSPSASEVEDAIDGVTHTTDSAEMRERVAAGKAFRAERGGERLADMERAGNAAALLKPLGFESDARHVLLASCPGDVSLRHAVKVARSVADLAQKLTVGVDEVSMAVAMQPERVFAGASISTSLAERTHHQGGAHGRPDVQRHAGR